MLLKSPMKATLLAVLMVTYIGPSAGPPQVDEDYEAPDSEFPWSSGESEESENILLQPLADHDLNKNDDYYNLPELESELSSKQMLHHTDNPSEDTGEDLFDLLKNPAIDLDLKRMINLPWSRARKKKPNGQSKVKGQYCRISPAPTRRPACQGSTTDRCSSTSPSCLYTPKPTASPDMSTPRLPPPTPKPPPCRGKSSKGRQKPRFRTLNSKTAAMLLKVILDTKQHVLFALEILNHMENEVLVRSPDTCQRLNCNLRTTVPKKQRPAPKQKPPKFPSCSGYLRKNPSSKEKKLQQKVQLASSDPEDNWSPPFSNRVKNLPLDTIKPMVPNRYNYKKYQKQQPKMKTIPPGMIAIIV